MYAFFNGKVDEKFNDRIVIDVNSIGYEIYLPENEINKLEINQDVKIYTYLHVREDEMKLFGFLFQEELNFFKKLINVSGVGPKAAIGIISNISVTDMCLAIATENIYTLKTIPGIGPKMAQKIIFELKDKVLKEQMNDLTAKKSDLSSSNRENINEAITALEALGFSYKIIDNEINKLELTDEKVEDIIKKVLKQLQR